MTPIARLTISLIGIGFSALAFAGPVIAPGDMGLRHDIQVLADWGVIRGPTTTWPLDWTAVEADLRRARDEDLNLPVPVRATFNAVYARTQRELQRGRQHWLKGRAAVAAEPMTIRGFQDTPREEGELSIGYEYFNDRVTEGQVIATEAPDDIGALVLRLLEDLIDDLLDHQQPLFRRLLRGSRVGADALHDVYPGLRQCILDQVREVKERPRRPQET